MTAERDPRARSGSTAAASKVEGVPIADLTERELIARIQARLPPPPDWLLVGIGDDAAVVEPERNRLDVLTVDALVEGVHFDRRFTPPDAIGYRALAANLSDLAAMGASPRLALLSLALPSTLVVDDLDEMIGGLARLAARHRLHVGGGNLTRSPGPLMIDVTVVGSVKRRQALTRAGARPGDEIYVSGSIGAAAAGLQMLRDATRDGLKTVPYNETSSHHVGDGLQTAAADETHHSRVGDGLQTVPDDEACVRRYLYPEPRIRLGLLLARNRAASACMDLSDGLADGVHQIAEASGVGVMIDADRLPIDPCVRTWFGARGGDAVTQAMIGGDDYELLFTVRPQLRARLQAARRHGHVALTCVGVCTAEREVLIRRNVDSSVQESTIPRGFSHFG